MAMDVPLPSLFDADRIGHVDSEERGSGGRDGGSGKRGADREQEKKGRGNEKQQQQPSIQLHKVVNRSCNVNEFQTKVDESTSSSFVGIPIGIRVYYV